jgi:hypothetical protein
VFMFGPYSRVTRHPMARCWQSETPATWRATSRRSVDAGGWPRPVALSVRLSTGPTRARPPEPDRCPRYRPVTRGSIREGRRVVVQAQRKVSADALCEVGVPARVLARAGLGT